MWMIFIRLSMRLQYDSIMFVADMSDFPKQLSHIVSQNTIDTSSEPLLFQSLGAMSQKKKESMSVQLKTHSEILADKQQIDHSNDRIQEQVSAYYLDCLKTQWILQIVEMIEKSQWLPTDDRQVAEMMYLLVCRCFNNMSFVKYKIEQREGELISNLRKNMTVAKLYKKVVQQLEHYSKGLEKIQNQPLYMARDGVLKIFFSQESKEKDKFLAGIENNKEQLDKNESKGQQNSGYSMKQQIDFTDNKYIKPILNRFKEIPLEIAIRLSNYHRINLISQADLNHFTFPEKVQYYLQM